MTDTAVTDHNMQVVIEAVRQRGEVESELSRFKERVNAVCDAMRQLASDHRIVVDTASLDGCAAAHIASLRRRIEDLSACARSAMEAQRAGRAFDIIPTEMQLELNSKLDVLGEAFNKRDRVWEDRASGYATQADSAEAELNLMRLLREHATALHAACYPLRNVRHLVPKNLYTSASVTVFAE